MERRTTWLSHDQLVSFTAIFGGCFHIFDVSGTLKRRIRSLVSPLCAEKTHATHDVRSAAAGSAVHRMIPPNVVSTYSTETEVVRKAH